MADSDWLNPDLGAPSIAVVIVLAVVVLLAAVANWARSYAPSPVRAPDLARERRALRMRALVLQAVVIAVVLGTVAVDDGVSWADVGLREPNGPDVTTSWVLTGYAVVLLGVGVLVWRRRGTAGFMPRRRLPGAFAAQDGHPLQVAVLAFGIGVSEELLFRGLFGAAGVGVLGLAPSASLLVVALFFGMVHSYQGVRGVLGATLLGVLLGALYLQSRSLLMPIVLHTLIDLRVFVLLPVPAGAGER